MFVIWMVTTVPLSVKTPLNLDFEIGASTETKKAVAFSTWL